MTTNPGPITVPAGAGHSFYFGGLGVHWKIDGHLTDQLFAVVSTILWPPAPLLPPCTTTTRKMSFKYMVTGRLGALLGENIVIAHPGTWVFKPRHQWHTFWNDGDEPCGIVEIISPAGFENYFRDVAASWGDVNRLAEINQRYSLKMRFDSVPNLCRRFNVTFPSLQEAQRPIT